MNQGTRHTLTVTSRENAGIMFVKMQAASPPPLQNRETRT